MPFNWREINTLEHMRGVSRDLPAENPGDAAASLVQEYFGAANRMSFDYRVESELRLLEYRSRNFLRPDPSKGVVAAVGYTSTEHFAGTTVMFRSANLVGPPHIFPDPQTGINQFFRTPRIEPGRSVLHRFYWGTI